MRPLEKKASHNKSRGAMLKKNLKKGSHILSMTSAGGHKNWESYGAISIAKAGLESACRQLFGMLEL